MNATYSAAYVPSGGSSSSTNSANPNSTQQTSDNNASPQQNSASSDAPMTPDVVANPWNTSLLWSSGILDNRDPRSSFWPASNWRNASVPENVNTAPIGYYYTSSTAGDSVNFYFSGHGLSVLDFRGPSRGKYNVTIDNTTSVIVDAYSTTDELAKSSGSELPPAIWTSETFAEGTHYVVMSNLNNVSDMNFWGVVINPNNYKPGKSFVAATSNTKVIVIASSVTAAVMTSLFLLVGSLVYYYKLLRPRRQLQAQFDAERKHGLLPPSSSSSNLDATRSRRSSPLRLDTNFLTSQGDLGRVHSRVTATTNESQYWVRPATELAQVTDTRQSNRTPAVFQEICLERSDVSAASSPVQDFSPVSEIGVGSTLFQTEIGEPLSPLSPTNAAYATAHTPTHHFAFWENIPAPNGQPEMRQLSSHQHSSSLPFDSSMNASAAPAAGASSSHFHHDRIAPIPNANPFRDPPAPTATSLTRTGSRRPLPIPPTSASPVSPMTTLSPFANPPTLPSASSDQSGTADTSLQSPVSVGRRASQRYRIEQDACSFHLSEDGMFDDHTGETLLPPPYAPRDMGRQFV